LKIQKRELSGNMNKFTFLTIIFIIGFFAVNNVDSIVSYATFYPADDFGAEEARIIEIKEQYKDVGFKGLWLFLILVGFILYLEKDYFEDSFLTIDIYKKLNDVHRLIKKKRFVDAVSLYYPIKTEFERLHRKRSRLKKRVIKLKDEVELYLKANHAYELARDDKVGLVRAMNEVLELANKVSKEAPEDEELYKYAKKQYDYCKKKFRR